MPRRIAGIWHAYQRMVTPPTTGKAWSSRSRPGYERGAVRRQFQPGIVRFPHPLRRIRIAASSLPLCVCHGTSGPPVIWVSTIHGLPVPIGSLGWREVRRRTALVGGRKRRRCFTFAELSVLNVTIWGSFPAQRGSLTHHGGSADRGGLAVGCAKQLSPFIDNINKLMQYF